MPQGWLDVQAPLIGGYTIALAISAAFALAVLATLFGVWRGRSGDNARELAAGTRMGTSIAAQRFGRLLVVAQASLATLLLASSALLAHSLWKLSHVDLGFDARGVVTFRLNPATALYPDSASVQRFAQILLDRLRAEPGVREAALTTTLPIGSQFNVSMRLSDGRSLPEAPQYHAVSTRSFATLGIPLVGGREFAESDRGGAEPVAIVNAAFAHRYLGGDAIGQLIKVDDGDSMPMPLMRIVGVAADVRQFGPQEEAPPIVYVPLAQVPDGLLNLVRKFVPLNAVVRVDAAAAASVEHLRTALREVDARQGVAGMRLFERDVADTTAPQRMNAALVGLFATLAMCWPQSVVFGHCSRRCGTTARVRRACCARCCTCPPAARRTRSRPRRHRFRHRHRLGSGAFRRAPARSFPVRHRCRRSARAVRHRRRVAGCRPRCHCRARAARRTHPADDRPA